MALTTTANRRRPGALRAVLPLALFLAFAGLTPTRAPADQDCEALGGLIALQVAAARLSLQSGTQSPQDMQRLSRLSRGVDRAAVEATLARKNLQRHGRDVSAFLALSAAEDARSLDPARLSQMAGLLRAACKGDDAESGDSASASGRLVMGKRLQTARSGWSGEPWSSSEIIWNFTISGGLIAAVIAGLALLWLARRAYDWGFAYVFVRHACEIHATMIFQGAPIHGVIRILGRHGCRFVADEAADRLRLEQAPLQSAAAIIIAEHRFPVDIDDAHEDHAVLYFKETLTEDIVSHLLRRSVSTPRLAAKLRPRKGRRLRRAKRRGEAPAPA